MPTPLKLPVIWPRPWSSASVFALAVTTMIGAPAARTVVAAPLASGEAPSTQAAEAANKATRTKSGVAAFDGEGIRLRALPRNTQQIQAFYEARGFPKPALAEFANKCFLTVSVRNQGADIVWLEPSNWRYHAAGEELKRLDLAYWNGIWERIELKPAYRATFRWTQLPDSRDLRPSEPVGGNVVLPYTDKPITVEASFARGADKTGEPLAVKIENLRCGESRP